MRPVSFAAMGYSAKQHVAASRRQRKIAVTTRLKRRKFVESYLQTFNPEIAATEAGYRPKHGSVLLRNPEVQTVLEGRLSELARHVTPAWIETRLAQLATYSGDGMSHSAQVQATTVLAKIRGLMTERHLVGGKHEITVRHVHETDRGMGG